MLQLQNEKEELITNNTSYNMKLTKILWTKFYDA